LLPGAEGKSDFLTGETDMERIEYNTDEIAFNGLSAADEIAIHTINSRYRFLLIDPAEKRGLLSGGLLGDRQREAILVGTLASKTRAFAIDSPVMKVGDRVLFCLIDGNEAENFFTTVIQQLAHIRASDGRRASAARMGQVAD
jgi:hypothetical protein